MKSILQIFAISTVIMIATCSCQDSHRPSATRESTQAEKDSAAKAFAEFTEAAYAADSIAKSKTK